MKPLPRRESDLRFQLLRRLHRAISTLPFVISTGAQRSGEICGSAVPSWKCFSTQASKPVIPSWVQKLQLYFDAVLTRCMVMVPQKSRARICTGMWRSSSVYQIQMLPRFLTTPASAIGCTRMV